MWSILVTRFFQYLTETGHTQPLPVSLNMLCFIL